MRVEILYFGVLKDLFVEEREPLELAGGATVEVALCLLRLRASKQSDVWKTLAVAVNREYAGRDTVLQDGDEVALLPPVSGGLEEAEV